MGSILKQVFADWVPRINKEIEEFFKKKVELARNFREINERVVIYSKDFTLSPGKRVRPVLFLVGLLSQG
ncbi:MAG: hypothetical protein GXO00_00300, partial [Candidatus Diapherotrites archaeon]|nr:hypothetical protein [Candidatus Diapherotrites archaeon]